MLLHLVDVFRCPAAHEAAALVLSVDAWREQRIWRGTLGCPVCHARYAIADGAVDFGQPRPAGVRHGGGTTTDALRLAAQLSLTEPGGLVLLTGRYAAAHEPLIELADVTCLLVDADRVVTRQAVNLEGVGTLPLADGCLRGAAVDRVRTGDSFLTDVARCLRPSGRMVAPAAAPVPPNMALVAGDLEEWVAESSGVAQAVTLGRAKAP